MINTYDKKWCKINWDKRDEYIKICSKYINIILYFILYYIIYLFIYLNNIIIIYFNAKFSLVYEFIFGLNLSKILRQQFLNIVTSSAKKIYGDLKGSILM